MLFEMAEYRNKEKKSDKWKFIYWKIMKSDENYLIRVLINLWKLKFFWFAQTTSYIPYNFKFFIKIF